MAHVADFMVSTPSTTTPLGLNNYIARALSPVPPLQDIVRFCEQAAYSPCRPRLTQPKSEAKHPEEKDKFVWRMHQPAEQRKYQLFPAKDKLTIMPARLSPSPSPDPERLNSSVLNTPVEKGRITPGAMRMRSKDQSLVRRRKASVPELGPMTTVQEIAMDSQPATIPGRPPVHERSISAPGSSWRQNAFGEAMVSFLSGPMVEEPDETTPEEHQIPDPEPKPRTNSPNISSRANSPKRPLSPKVLAPLIIPGPNSATHRPIQPCSATRQRSESTPPEVPPKSARFLDHSPLSRPGLTPLSASTSNLSSATTAVAPNSGIEGPSPNPWSAGPTHLGHSRGASESSQKPAYKPTHRRGESDMSIMDRGRPKKRPEGIIAIAEPRKRSKSTEQKEKAEQLAFETLPQGVRAADASAKYQASEIDSLRKQAIGQAARFEVLTSKDVEALSKELRALDDRCDYLRKTHRSLRAGRRNLHERICSYLRSPRTARFSHESLLKQEEALSELDNSIDDWVSKLERAENRRTRVRQKLLEHVAAALTLGSPSMSLSPQVSQVQQQDLDRAKNNMSTPPRSPIKSHSPPRLASPVEVASPEPLVRQSLESIRIYADSDVYALLADVEEEINRMGQGYDDTSAVPNDGQKLQESPLIEKKEEEVILLSAVTYNAPKSAK
ncbi:Up-regulated during septation-domain-containing protein [Xylogone sp. PMI_703]|nr:Up-regulated during septation-domain-containing protein [Xylogone sp. PMI_703]